MHTATVIALLAAAAALALPAPAGAALPRLRAPGHEGAAEIRLRGNFSRTLPKKPYRLELEDDAPLLGMPADDDWVLNAAYYDRTLMRNALAYAVSRSIGRYAPRTRFVELSIRGRSRGVYVLMERLELHPRRVRGGEHAFLMEMTSPRQASDEEVAFHTPLLGNPFLLEDGDEDRVPAIRARFDSAERAIVTGGPGAW